MWLELAAGLGRRGEDLTAMHRTVNAQGGGGESQAQAAHTAIHLSETQG